MRIIVGDERPIRAAPINLPGDPPVVGVALKFVSACLRRMIAQTLNGETTFQVLFDYLRYVF